KVPREGQAAAPAVPNSSAGDGAVGDSVVTGIVPRRQQQHCAPLAAPKTESPAQVVGRQVKKVLAWLQAAGVARGHFSPLQWFVFALVPVVLVSAYVVTNIRHRTPPPPPPL